MKHQKLSDLMFGKPPKAFQIRDYAKIDYIFGLYTIGYYDTMSREIYFYKAWEFFIDLSVFLHMKFKNKYARKFFHSDIFDEYVYREQDIKDELAFKKELKKYGL